MILILDPLQHLARVELEGGADVPNATDWGQTSRAANWNLAPKNVHSGRRGEFCCACSQTLCCEGVHASLGKTFRLQVCQIPRICAMQGTVESATQQPWNARCPNKGPAAIALLSFPAHAGPAVHGSLH